uniref:Uncharacterized protein LOC104224899 isoform X3 n=1 Tax=Nicotiana sylvestris TaxID=4096 RepID=A0A1U7W8G3_NICSY|nr:PREDICTED: uncharacterized protein LOC104224899 isoform X3 [Nicotiana sylvestris]
MDQGGSLFLVVQEMRGIGRGRCGRGGNSYGRENFQGRGNFGATSQPHIQTGRVSDASVEMGQPSNPSQGPLQTGRVSTNSLQIPSLETQSSRNVAEPVHCSPEAENCAISSSNKKRGRGRGRGKYKSKSLEVKTKCGGKIKITIPDDIDRVVGSGARDIVNYCSLIMRSTISFQNGNWQKIVLKYGEVMWLKVKDKFEVCSGLREHRFQAFVISTMQRLFRAWKARLSIMYSKYNTNEERLSHRPEDVELEDWKYLIRYFGSPKFKVASERNKRNRDHQIIKHTYGTKSFAEVEESTRNPITGELDTPDKVWEIQHTRKDGRGELVWLDSQSQQIHGQLQEVVAQQQSEDIEHPMTRDEILSSVVGERTGYVRGKGYGKKPPKKSNIQQANIEASVSSAIDIVRQEMQAEMDSKLQEEREQMASELRRNMEIELERKLAEERQHANEERQHANAETDKRISLEVEKKMHEQFASFLTRMQQQQGQGT